MFDEPAELNSSKFVSVRVVSRELRLQIDPLKWWSEVVNGADQLKQQFGRAFPIAVCFLGIPESEADVERLFSYTGDILDRKRNRLGDTNLRILAVINDYYKQKNFNFDLLMSDDTSDGSKSSFCGAGGGSEENQSGRTRKMMLRLSAENVAFVR